MGRLHTRYSPVRRSPPEVLPLDLHVLGLSLAFILSQDQTLRCTFFIVYLMLAINKVIDGKAFVLHLLYPKYVLANIFVNFKLSKIVYFDY